MTSRAKDLKGIVYGKLTVLEQAVNKPNIRQAQWLCRCVCGKELVVRSQDLRNGHTTSCGCNKNVKHGYSYSRVYSIWQAMKDRCYNTNNPRYLDYGGRGITICDDWMSSFEQFNKDMGERPTQDHSIDRIDNNGNYEPSNCKWSTRSEQQTNKRKSVQ